MKKGSYKWNEEAIAAFETLKQTFVSPPVLQMPDFSKEFVVECDASSKELGAVLMQENKPIAYSSYGLNGKALFLLVYEKEMLAIISAITKWRQYLLERKFFIKTDKRSIKFLLDQRLSEESQHPWLIKLSEFDF